APPAKAEPKRLTRKERRALRAAAAAASASAAVESKEADVVIRARVAPVRATPDGDGKVLCSVKRGAVMHSVRQTPGSKGRWYGVSCDKDSPGWVHENFVSRP
ncbi:MAG TPA: SH3 domain-containing protein, partial [Polyangiales bacterium]|nr:SH3 domain-containing protein [Polyangiales bacterium]